MWGMRRRKHGNPGRPAPGAAPAAAIFEQRLHRHSPMWGIAHRRSGWLVVWPLVVSLSQALTNNSKVTISTNWADVCSVDLNGNRNNTWEGYDGNIANPLPCDTAIAAATYAFDNYSVVYSKEWKPR